VLRILGSAASTGSIMSPKSPAIVSQFAQYVQIDISNTGKIQMLKKTSEKLMAYSPFLKLLILE